MFLKSLEIFGFKSFADRTHINFADGITALLGPNGCGKSNVVDAVKWVLAENKSKNLRAASMEDVIFNGTESRPALSVAEVTLTISNEKNLLPIDDSELALKRRLYRSGENEYFINGRQATATEVRRLFMDTGVGKAAYSVMEQGKIDQILSSKPEDRRYLFEEAAGISRSKAKVEEAERELERTRANLAQIDIGLAETKRNYESLKVQAEKTKKYRELNEAKFNQELDIQLLKLKDFTQNKARHDSEKTEAEQKRDAVIKEIEEIYNTLNENTDKIKSLQEEANTKNQELIQTSAEQNGKKNMAKQLKIQQTTIKEKISQLEGRIKSTKDRINDFNDEIDAFNADLYEKNKKVEEINSNIKSFSENIHQSASQIEDNRQQISENLKNISQLERERLALQEKLTSITEDIVTELDAKLKDAGYSSSASKRAKEELSTSLEKIKIFAKGRLNILKDWKALPNHTEAESNAITEDAVKAFSDLGAMLDSLSSSIDNYTKTTPQFIDDFLSPEGIITKKRGIDSDIQSNIESVSELQKANEELNNLNSELNKKIEEYKETLNKMRVTQAQFQSQIDACKQQISLQKKMLAETQNSLSEQEGELFEEKKRSEGLDDEIQEIDEQIAELEYKGQKLAKELDSLDLQIKECNSKTSGKETALQKKTDEKNKWQAKIQQYTISIAQSQTEIANIKQNFQEHYSRDLMEFEERMYTITESPAVIREKLADTKQKIAALGQVNMMALDQFSEEKDRYERQQKSYDDAKKTLADLERVSGEIRTKSTEMFLDTYNKIRKNFHNMFRRLFDGGRAELRLVDPANVLTTGIDIYAQPPGKKLENISLLSGGEKTMTALALLFATYQVRPSPFCLLDEIDAALDGKNVASFVNVLRAFANISQYIVITHNHKTATGASSLLGVTMEESGITKVAQIRMDDNTLNGQIAYDKDDNFVEEDVPPEEGIVIPPRPPRREHNPDGSLKESENVSAMEKLADSGNEENSENTEKVEEGNSENQEEAQTV